MSKARSAALAATVSGLAVIFGVAMSPFSPVAAFQQPGPAPAFLQPGSCYRIAFPIDGAPNYKVLELLEDGWIRAEVDAGSGKAQRQALWINSAQIVTMREARCSE